MTQTSDTTGSRVLLPDPGEHRQWTGLPAGDLRVSAGRRLLDICLATVALVLLCPLLVTVATAILLTDGRPVLFRQRRLGEHGIPFELYKLRTMRVANDGPGVTASADTRVTPVGTVLRRLSIDELPQLWHVLTGRMTLVGPRPESEVLAARYPSPCRPVLLARPGLTGPSQLRYRESSATPPSSWTDVESWYLTVLVPLRVTADLGYLRRATVLRTVAYLLLTVVFVLGLADLERPRGHDDPELVARRGAQRPRMPQTP